MFAPDFPTRCIVLLDQQQICIEILTLPPGTALSEPILTEVTRVLLIVAPCDARIDRLSRVVSLVACLPIACKRKLRNAFKFRFLLLGLQRPITISRLIVNPVSQALGS
eukprot:6212133-Pleurochrysis_carterae.AAC.1